MIRSPSEAKSAPALNSALPLSLGRANWTAMNDDPKFLAMLEFSLEGARLAGLPE
jgi:hypothetical protein